ncbi:methionine--tRNA ligase [Candidatus Woesearchaeota archaeon]|nr:MAG: methionine--tRNA ligase [Candidatus Woesearchaeota archaeon]
MTKILVTSALPYANGSIHIGHLVEYIQTDILVRFLKLIGEDVIYCCADDTHGAPIEINAAKQGVPPEKFIEKFHKEHQEDFKLFQIEFDSYYSTNSKENKYYSDLIFNTLKEKNLIYTKEIELTYCESCKRFLPDRYVKGKCPKCGAEDQYGDVCEKCHSTYKTTDLIEPYCTLCKSKPVRKTSKHYFFKLSSFSQKLEEWLKQNKELQPEIRNQVLNWIKEGLEDWCISRDGPYFGFKIPGEEDKYYYVWLDAPIGYISSTEHYCKNHNCSIEEYWKGKNSKIIHVIGKDIAYFHLLFWPAMLMGSGFNLPHNVLVHGFLNVNREKMSKSRGTFLTAKEFAEHISPEFLRFYYAANLSRSMTDINLDLNDFKDKINNELVANIANFCYRVLSFINKNYNSELAEVSDSSFYEEVQKDYSAIEESYKNYEFRQAVQKILAVSSKGNKYFQENEPWKLIRDDRKKAHEILTLCAHLVRDLAVLLKSVLPGFCRKLEEQLGLKDLKWDDLGKSIENKKINAAKPLISKIEDELEVFSKKEDPFSKLDLRVAKVLNAEDHPQAEKLYVLSIDLGAEKRTLVAGLKGYYSKEQLKGKKIVVVANLKPACLRGIESKGMLLAAEDKEKKVALLLAEKSEPGDRVFVNGINQEPKKQLEFKEFLQAKMVTSGNKVLYNNKELRTEKELISVKGVADNALVH